MSWMKNRASIVLAGLVTLLLVPGGSASAQVQTKDQQKCTGAMNKDLEKLAATLGKDIDGCIKNFGKGKTDQLGPGGTAEGCIGADVKGKVGKAAGKLGTDWGKRCTGTDKAGEPKLPAWGVTDPNTLQEEAVAKEIFLIRDLFGSDLDFVLSQEKNASKCQEGVFKSVLKCQDTIMKEFNKCKKDGLKGKSGAPFDEAADLASCIGADPKGKIAKACDDPAKPDKIRKDIDKKCVAKAVDLSGAFPGCNTDDPGSLHACLSRSADCRACSAIKRGDGFPATCSACIPDGPIGTATCTYDSRSWCVGGPRDGEPCTDGISNSDCGPPGDRGNCLALSSTYLVNRLSSPDPILDITQVGEVRLTVGAPDPVTGLASLDCRLNWSSRIDLSILIGSACITDFPKACAQGQIDCDGGEPVDKTFQAYHDIGSCGVADDPNETDPNNLVGPSECDALCDAHCAGLAGSFVSWPGRTGCEGYCRGGAKAGTRCKNDIDCFVANPSPPPDWDLDNSGECIGGEPVAHAGRCNCACLEVGGGPSRSGSYRCEIPLRSFTVPYLDDCSNFDVKTVSQVCVPFTTERVSTEILDADEHPGESVGPRTDLGWPAGCERMARDSISGHRFVGDSYSFDGGLGDLVQPLFVTCQ